MTYPRVPGVRRKKKKKKKREDVGGKVLLFPPWPTEGGGKDSRKGKEKGERKKKGRYVERLRPTSRLRHVEGREERNVGEGYGKEGERRREKKKEGEPTCRGDSARITIPSPSCWGYRRKSKQKKKKGTAQTES